MRYTDIREAVFLDRPNRFIAQVQIDGKTETVHVKNTGRCKELLKPGVRVLVEPKDSNSRKTKYDLISVYKDKTLINIDSQIPNAVVKEWILKGNLFSDLHYIRGEKQYGGSRFDLYAEYGKSRAFIEVKGVTLEEDGTARFPDAPTERGIKHLKELGECRKAGYEAYVIFVIQMKGIKEFQPNWKTHARFGEALQEAQRAGVQVRAYDCQVTADSIVLDLPVPVDLEREGEPC